MIAANSVADLFFKRVQQSSFKDAYAYKSGGAWRKVSWSEHEKEVFAVVGALKACGVKSGDRVAILSQNSYKWAIVDRAVLSMGAITVPIYPSLMTSDVAHILNDCQPKVVFIEDDVQCKKIHSLIPSMDFLTKIVSFITLERESIVSWKEFTSKIEINEESMDLWRVEARVINQESIASIIYTSGTTGKAKGVVLSHGNFLSVIDDAIAAMGVTEADTTLQFLPLAHVMGRIEIMVALGSGWVNYYSSSIKKLIDELPEVRPTVLMSVPRIYEKVYEAILQKVEQGSKLEQRVFTYAKKVATWYGQYRQSRKPVPYWITVQKELLDEKIFSKVRERFGGRLRFALTGGAPFSKEIAEFFLCCGIKVVEGYGLTETTGPIIINNPQEFKFSSVGRPMRHAQVKIARDGELLLKGSGVFKEYYNNPQSTKDSFQGDWFASGDIGEIDEEGFVKITDRKKDLIVTAGGKNIAPQKIESLMNMDALITGAIVIGDKRKYLSSLITVDQKLAVKLAQEHDLPNDFEELISNGDFLNLIQTRINKMNQDLPSFETVKKFKIVPREFSVEGGELTPSLKVKRRYCMVKYSSEIQSMYS